MFGSAVSTYYNLQRRTSGAYQEIPLHSLAYIVGGAGGSTFSFHGGPVQPGPSDGLPGQEYLVRARKPFWTSYSRKQLIPIPPGRIAFQVFAELTPFPFPQDGWAYYEAVGVVPVPIVKTPPLVQSYQFVPTPFPADGWALEIVGVLPVPIVKTPPLNYAYQIPPTYFYPADGSAYTKVGVVPVPIVKTPLPLTIPQPQTVPNPYPADGFSISVRGVVPVPIVKTPPLVYAADTVPQPWPPPGSAIATWNIFGQVVVVVNNPYPTANVTLWVTPVPFPPPGNSLSIVGTVPVPIVKTPLLVQTPPPLPVPFPDPGFTVGFVGVVPVPFVQPPPLLQAVQAVPAPFPAPGVAIYNPVGVVPVPIQLYGVCVFAKTQLTPVPYPAEGTSFGIVGVVPVPIVKPPPLVQASQVVVQPFPPPGSALSIVYYTPSIKVTPALTHIKDIYAPVELVTGGQGGQAFEIIMPVPVTYVVPGPPSVGGQAAAHTFTDKYSPQKNVQGGQGGSAAS